ncbi:MAG TPA: protoporphyrinogen oxidase, partial [Pyrinomonadaceae bacterium]|nr:protoporphyrinogen oxidase [Pyrinomonadaceae bacterium]
LAAANRLVELRDAGLLDFEITLLEATDRLGGVIRTEHRDGFLLELGPDSFIWEKPEALQLAKTIGLEPNLIETNEHHRRSFIVRDGRLRRVPEGFHLLAPSRLWPFVTSDIFSWPGKLRMAMDLVLPRRHINGTADESLASFVRRRLGCEALERMAQPMVGGIYTANPERLSLRATMPRFLEIEQEHRSLILGMRRRARAQTVPETEGTSGARYSLFLSFDGGMQMLVDQLSARLPAGTARLNTAVESIGYEPSQYHHAVAGGSTGQYHRAVAGGWAIETTSHEVIRADGVCIALPAYATARLVHSTNSALADELDAIQYASTATVNVAYRRADIPHPLNGFGFVVPFIEKRSIIACTFSSVKFPGRAPENHALLRAFVGGAMQPEMFELDDTEMIRRVQNDLHDLLGVKEPPLFTKVTRWSRSMPQYEVGHLERVSRVEEQLSRLPGLRLASNAYNGAGIPDCIRSGEIAADTIYHELPKTGAN